MAHRRHFEKPLNRHKAGAVQRIAMKFSMITHFDPLKPSNGQKFDFKTHMADSRYPNKSAVDILSDSARRRTGTVRMPIGEHNMRHI